MVAIPIVEGVSPSTLDKLAGPLVGSLPGAAAPPSPGSTGATWSNSTITQTYDPANGRNETRAVTEATTDTSVKMDRAVLISLGMVGGLAVLVVAGWLFNSWRNRRTERAVTRIKNPDGAAAERAAAKDSALERSSNPPLMGYIPRVARWLREQLWDGSPAKRETARTKLQRDVTIANLKAQSLPALPTFRS